MPKRINKAIELLEQGQPVFTMGQGLKSQFVRLKLPRELDF